jgi:ABC-type glycerol-3-phosphate transport system substrate-binding protein
MKLIKSAAFGSAFAILAGTTAMAGCGIESGNVSIIGNDFPAIQAIAAAASACQGDGVTVAVNLTKEHETLNAPGMTSNPAQYSVAVVANSSIVPLMNDGLIRPLDDLIAQYAPDLPDVNKVTVDGKVMAVAFMANAQHLYYRSDILDAVGVAPPKTYEEVLAAAEAIRAAGAMEYPVALNTKAGWNLAEEFVNMYMGMGGELFEAGSAAPSIQNEKAVASLEMIKSLVSYSNPDFLTFDSNATQALWESGDLALATMWGSRGGAVLDAEGSSDAVTSTTVLAAAPTVAGGTIPASTLWWDGFTIATNVSDADAAASFQAMMAGLTADVVTANADAAVWLNKAYMPGPASAGVVATAGAGAKPYPMLPYVGLMHTALGDNLAEFLQGTESAEQALADATAAYETAAKDAGFLQ